MLCDKKHSHVQWRDFKMNVLVCDDDQQIVDSIIEELKKKSEETHVALRFYGFSQPSQIDLSLPYDIALLDIDMGETNGIELPTTKPEPQLHGFGLANIRLILEKYSGEYTMFYENGWFQFTADIPLTPIS